MNITSKGRGNSGIARVILRVRIVMDELQLLGIARVILRVRIVMDELQLLGSVQNIV